MPRLIIVRPGVSPLTTSPLNVMSFGNAGGFKVLFPTVPRPKPSVDGIVAGGENVLNCQPWSPGFTATRFEDTDELGVRVWGVQETGWSVPDVVTLKAWPVPER